MRSMWRTMGRRLARDIALVCLADGIVGVSFGAIAASSGFEVWVPMLLSVVVFAGGAQFLFIGILTAGGGPVAAVLAGLLVNARHLPFGFAVADLLGSGWLRRTAGTHIMIDEAVAFAVAQRTMARRRAAYWTCGLGLFVSWNVGVVAGSFAGTVITDTDVFGLDAAFPAVLLALLLPSLTDPVTRRAALSGVVVALATTPLLPSGLPVLLALVGVAFVLGAQRGEAPATTAAGEQHSRGGNDCRPGNGQQA